MCGVRPTPWSRRPRVLWLALRGSAWLEAPGIRPRIRVASAGRPVHLGRMIIAIDGPAGSGKSTVAQLVAQELGCLMLNTGAMYRAVGVAVHEAGVSMDDEAACAQVAKSLDLDVDGQGRLLSRGRVVDADGLLGEGPGAWASRVARLPAVREVLVSVQQRIGERWDLVTEGRDTTTVVFPHADHKFFVTASLAERARRRLGQTGFHKNLEALMLDIEARDRQDEQREVAPLMRADDATEILTDGLTIQRVVELILGMVRRGASDGTAEPKRQNHP